MPATQVHTLVRADTGISKLSKLSYDNHAEEKFKQLHQAGMRDAREEMVNGRSESNLFLDDP